MDLSSPTNADVPTNSGPSGMMDVFIRFALIFALAWLCYWTLSPFLTLAIWSIVLAVTLYPLHQAVARRVSGKQWLASVIILAIGLLLIIVPAALLMNSFADSVRGFITAVQNDTLQIPTPRESVLSWPVIGEKIYDVWTNAYDDMPGLVLTLQPKIGEFAGAALSTVAGIGTTVLMFLASFIVASIVMAYGEAADRTSTSVFSRVAGSNRGPGLAKLSTATIRTVALGVIGVAAIQALLIGVVLILAGVPAAGVLAIIVLVLGIAQVPALVVVLPAIIYIWTSGTHETTSAVIFTIVLLLTGLVDNLLKPLMLGRGVDVPMPVILFGALGGMAGGGILGMFVGATALALGYGIFMAWVSNDTETAEERSEEPSEELMVTAQAASLN